MTEELSNYKVNDVESFVKFIDLLKNDFINNRDKWENRDLESFLDALGSYAEDMQGYYNNSKEGVDANVPSWQTFADIFKGATMYE